MENTDINNAMGLSAVDFDDGESVSADKIKRAYEFYESGRYSESLALAENDTQINTTAFGQVLIGNCYRSLNDKTKAISHWQKAVEISPLEYTAYINIGNEYYKEGKLNEAIYNWHLACTITPENPTVNLNLANAYNRKNSRIKATKYFEKYLLYQKSTSSPEYHKIKHTLTNLTAKIDFYAKKVEEFKLKRDLKSIAALYLKMIATYANLPAIYANIAEIFYFDKNYEKALEFYLLVYLYYPHTTKILLEIANLYSILGQNSYAYVYYKRALDFLPDGTSYHTKVKLKISSLAYVLKEPEIIDSHLQKAKEAENDNDYELAIDEYENYLILSESENPDIQQLIDKYKIFANPEPFVINVLYNQIPDLMNRKKLHACVEVCDRIMLLGQGHTKEVMYAMKCKAECRRIIVAREQFGV